MNLEITQKQKIIAEMREKLEKMIGVKAASKRDEDIVKNMTALVREKDAMIDRLRSEISSLVVSGFVICRFGIGERERTKEYNLELRLDLWQGWTGKASEKRRNQLSA